MALLRVEEETQDSSGQLDVREVTIFLVQGDEQQFYAIIPAELFGVHTSEVLSWLSLELRDDLRG